MEGEGWRDGEQEEIGTAVEDDGGGVGMDVIVVVRRRVRWG